MPKVGYDGVKCKALIVALSSNPIDFGDPTIKKYALQHYGDENGLQQPARKHRFMQLVANHRLDSGGKLLCGDLQVLPADTMVRAIRSCHAAWGHVSADRTYSMVCMIIMVNDICNISIEHCQFVTYRSAISICTSDYVCLYIHNI